MRLLHGSRRLPGVVHSERGLKVSSAGLEALLAPVAGALVVGVLVEMLLFRIFARTGIYLFHENTAQWAYRAFQTAVWVGNTMFNFAAILAIVLFAAVTVHLWRRRHAVGRVLPVMTAAMVAWTLALFLFSPGPTATLLYLLLSAAIVATSLIVAWRTSSRSARAALSILAASFMCVYYFETIAPLRLAGWMFDDHGVGVFQIGEGLVGVGILAAFVAWGRTTRLRLLVPPAIVAVLLAGAYVSEADRLPLISTWALGVTMSLPVWAYVAGAALLGVTLLKLFAEGRPLLGYGLAMLLFSHRMLPLAYFNILVLLGFVLIAIDLSAGRFRDRGAGARGIEAGPSTA